MKVLIKKEYYCDRCGKFITNEENRCYNDLYADDSIIIGDSVGEIKYNLLVTPFEKEKIPYYSRRLAGTKIFCTDCSLKIAVFLGLLKEDEYDECVIGGLGDV